MCAAARDLFDAALDAALRLGEVDSDASCDGEFEVRKELFRAALDEYAEVRTDELLAKRSAARRARRYYRRHRRAILASKRQS